MIASPLQDVRDVQFGLTVTDDVDHVSLRVKAGALTCRAHLSGVFSFAFGLMLAA